MVGLMIKNGGKFSMKKIPELLAPSGDITRLKAAVSFGADAVYLAGQEFGMRTAASNFSKEDLIEGSFRILEPKIGLEKYDPKENKSSLAVCLVPAIIYDSKGYRIGYGKGYYDRYLSGFSGTNFSTPSEL